MSMVYSKMLKKETEESSFPLGNQTRPRVTTDFGY